MNASTGQGTIRVTQRRAFLSEWTKLRSVRSTRYVLLAAVVLIIGLAITVAAVTVSRWATAPEEHFSALEPSMIGLNFAQLAIGVLGVLVISAEYSTGMIRSSLMAVTRRLPVLWAKAGVFAGVTLALMVPATLVAFFASQSILSGQNIQIAFSHPGVARAVLGSGVYLAIVGVFAVGLGAIVRNTAGGITAFAGIFFVLPGIMQVLPHSWNDAIGPYLPSNAGGQIMSIVRIPNTLSPWVGFAVFCGWTVLVMAVAAVLLVRRDA